MSALPSYHLRGDLFALPDDFYRTAAPDLKDQPTVTEAIAVRAVMDCVSGRDERAFGEDTEYWRAICVDVLIDHPADLIALVSQTVVSGSMRQSLRQKLHGAIHTEANRLLEQMFDNELDAYIEGTK